MHTPPYDDFEVTTVALTKFAGVFSKHVAEARDIHIVMLCRWRMEIRRGKIMAKKKSNHVDPEMASELKRLRKLERDHNILKQEHELLKKAIRHSLEQKKKSSSLKL